MEIWLPAVERRPEGIESAPVGQEGRVQSRRQLCVLAVDDDSLVLSNITALLEDLGHQVIAASSALRAMELLAKHPAIDVVISDQVMPVVTGLRLIEALRAQRPSLPAILATGFAEFPGGVDASIGRLAKPYTQQQLKAALEARVYGADAMGAMSPKA
jgi:CheY-like chemotaxis protein